MKNFKNNKVLFVAFCLLSFDTFGASEATKQLINKILAKYGISAGGKEICGTGREPEYNKDTGIVKCKNDSIGDNNNYWSPSDRLCKPCPIGTILNKSTFQACVEIKCPKNFELTKLITGQCPAGMEALKEICPEGYELKKITDRKCPEGFDLVDLSK